MRRNRLILAMIIAIVLSGTCFWLIWHRVAPSTGKYPGVLNAKSQQRGMSPPPIPPSLGPWLLAYRKSTEWQSGRRGPVFADLALQIGYLSLSTTVTEQQVLFCLGQPDATTYPNGAKCLVYYYSNTRPNDNAVWICIRQDAVSQVRWEVLSEDRTGAHEDP